MSPFVALIPLLPLLGFLFNLTVGVRVLTKRHGHGEAQHGPSPIIGLVACGSVLASLLVSIAAVVQARAQPGGVLVETLWTWLPGGAAGVAPFQIEWAYQVDPLSSVMLLVVNFVSFLIHVYSTGYMAHDPGYARYMAYLNLFMFAMLTLVLGANYPILFIGWEGVGLCSYLLIGFWFEKQSASDAGKKAFIVNRIGDAFFILGMLLLFETFGSLDFRTVFAAAEHLPAEHAWGGTLTLACLFLFLGACGKSAQIPLYVWLPDAMEGPTPVSALIHAATMVTAGVYMVARSSVLYAHAPNALLVVAVVGAATALFAASIGLVQYDIKRVLAYSTVSQLGYMFLACGVGAFAAGVFHLMTHAFFKALLFLGSGSVIHAMSGEQDMRKMGGLKEKLPVTHLTMFVGCLAIAGVPFLAGFFSKDEILWSAYKLGGYGRWVWMIGLVTAGMTAFYMFRLFYMTFHGAFRGTPEQAHHVHESPSSMTVPLVVLAGGSALAGYLGLPAVTGLPNVFEHFLEPVLEPAQHALRELFTRPVPGHGVEWALMGTSVAFGLLGIFVGRHFFKTRPEIPERLARAFAGPHRVLLNKYYVDELYGAAFVRGVALGGGGMLHGLDRHVVDGGDGEVRPGLGVNGLAWLARDIVARLSNFWDKWIVDGGLTKVPPLVLENLSYVFRAVQNGLVQHYALAMFIGVFLLIAMTLGLPY
ncbi:MAG TPA: NADH-quinone oxidoreductase subunit L [Vicinamibacteria bacterium]|nr:NADH-quinone oxidoreductase subunit L [Vicinamibacteria bacterium]